jgi:molybdopterin converting factor small subunit
MQNCIDKSLPVRRHMAKEGALVDVVVVVFGPLAERLGGRTHPRRLPEGSTIRQLVAELDLTEWIEFGLSVAINGDRCSVDAVLEDGVEVALLPPVSGG